MSSAHHSFSTATLLILATLATSNANAIVIEYQIVGSVSSLHSNLSGAFTTGNTVNATLMFDTTKYTLGASSSGIQQNYNYSSSTPGAYQFSLQLQGTGGTYTGTGTGGEIALINNWGTNGDWVQTSTFGSNFTATAPAGFTWSQTTLTLKDYDAGLLSSLALPDSIAELNSFADMSVYEEKFFTFFFRDSSNNPYSVNAEISSITSSLNTAVVVKDIVGGTLTDILGGEAEHNGGGALTVTFPDEVNGKFEASYSQQSLDQVDLDAFNFVIPGSVLQTWDLHFDNTLIPDGELVDLVFKYDDTGMTLFQELALDILHLVDGIWVPLNGTVDAFNNTITAQTPSFSNFAAGNPVPSPGVLPLLALGLMSMSFFVRRQAKLH